MQAPFRLALALLLQSPEQWAAARRPALAYTLRAHVQPSGGPSSNPTAADEAAADAGLAAQTWRAVAPAVRLFGMVDQLQRLLKAPADGAAGWQAAMDHRWVLSTAPIISIALISLLAACYWPYLAMRLTVQAQGSIEGNICLHFTSRLISCTGLDMDFLWSLVKGCICRRLSDLSAVDSAAASMLQRLKEAEDAQSAQQLFDALELVPLAMADGEGSCEDFVSASVRS